LMWSPEPARVWARVALCADGRLPA
jgi:hypothetical protein